VAALRALLGRAATVLLRAMVTYALTMGRAQLEPVAGGVCEEESGLRNKASSLDSSAASRLFSSRSSSVSFLICSVSIFSRFKRFSLSSSLSSCCFVRCSMS
jgi:hypothetical protein